MDNEAREKRKIRRRRDAGVLRKEEGKRGGE